MLDEYSVITIGEGESAVSFKPQDYSLTISGVDFETGRVASGMMERNQVGEKRSATIGLPPMSTEKIAPIMQAVSGLEHTMFKATIIDPTQPDCTYTGDFYVGDRSLPSYSWVLDLWDKATFTIIEF